MKEALSTFGSSPAFRFVFLMGVVDLFGDTTYSGGASMNGPFLAMLGASAAIVSITAGLSEFLNFLTRSIAGYLADRTGRYWLFVFAGYATNLVAVPAIALAGQWQIAAGLEVGSMPSIHRSIISGAPSAPYSSRSCSF